MDNKQRIINYISMKIYDERINKGINKARFAKKIGINYRQYCRLEQCEDSDLTLDQLLTMIDNLNLELTLTKRKAPKRN